MTRLTRSAAYRIAFTYSTVFALAIALLGAAVYFAADADFRYQQDASITQENSDLIRSYRDEGLGELRDAIVAREAGSATNAFGYALFDQHDRRIAGSLNTTAPPPGWHDISFIDPHEGADPARALVTVLPGHLRLVVAADTEALERIDSTILALFGGAFFVIVVIGTVGAFALGTYLRNRLGRISTTARSIMSGELGSRIEVSRREDEFDQLALALNAMLDRIAELLDNLRQVSSDVAHDLRTPLARLRGLLERALGAVDTDTELKQLLRNALAQSDDLLALFAAILRISEIEAGALAKKFQTIDLSALLADLCESYLPAVLDGGRTLNCSIAQATFIQGDKELMAQAVINLLDNAQCHTPIGTHITLELKAEANRIRLSVADDGPGVAAESRAHIVRRFGRLDTSRATPGHGLGLNLVSAVARMHGGAVVIDDNCPGLRVMLVIPEQHDRRA